MKPGESWHGEHVESDECDDTPFEEENMGDRGDIEMKDERGASVFLYTHHDGTELPCILQNALKRGKGRWDDSDYLRRVVFCEMIQDTVLAIDGYGISNQAAGDDQHPVIIVDVKDRTVRISDRVWTFEEYVADTKICYPAK